MSSELQERAKRDNDKIFIERERTKEEFEIAKETNPNVDPNTLRYTQDFIGKIDGLFIMTRSIRDVLVIDIENKLKDLLNLDPETSIHKLKSWYDWAQEIDNYFAEAELLIEEGKKFFSPDNINLIKNQICKENEKQEFSKILWEYDFNTSKTEKKIKPAKID